jgi:carboxypeptidase Q
VKQAEAFRDAAMEGSRAYEWLEALTTEVGPRLAGSEQEARAREWAISSLTQMGFGQVRVEPFTISGWERGAESARVISPYPQPLAVTALGGSIATPKGGITGELRGFASLDALEALPNGVLKGEIVYVGHAMRSTQDGSHYGYFGRLRREGASIAAAKGAGALLIRSIGTDSHRMPHTGSMTYAEGVAKIPAAALSNPDADQLERMLTRENAISVALDLQPRFVGEVPSGNVIADIVGAELPDEIVVIGGHLDSWDLGTGAIDDGAGVAITLEAARMILASGLRPRRTIRLILWGAEEVGLLGGKAYVERHQNSLTKHVIGTESDFGAGRIWKITSRVNDEALPLVNLIARLVEPLGIAPGSNTVASSGPDLTPMIERGMPGFRFVQDGRDYFDLHHTPDDTLDKVSAENLDQSVAAYVVFTWLSANSDLNDWGWQAD